MSIRYTAYSESINVIKTKQQIYVAPTSGRGIVINIDVSVDVLVGIVNSCIFPLKSAKTVIVSPHFVHFRKSEENFLSDYLTFLDEKKEYLSRKMCLFYDGCIMST